MDGGDKRDCHILGAGDRCCRRGLVRDFSGQLASPMSLQSAARGHSLCSRCVPTAWA